MAEDSPAAPRSGPEKTEAQAEIFANRLAKRWRHLRKWARRTGTGAFRLYDRDIPEVPLLLDLYLPAPRSASPVPPDGTMPPNAAAALSLFRRPSEKDDTAEAAWLSRMIRAARDVLSLRRERIFFRERRRLRGGERRDGGLSGGTFPAENAAAGERAALVCAEGGLRYRVRFEDRLDTGLFLDRRLLRARIREQAGGKRALNLFAYTCAFSVAAAAGGATEIDSVDLSPKYLEWGMANFALNGFAGKLCRPPPDLAAPRTAAYRFIAQDARRFIDGAHRARKTWDLIILDPPVFSVSARMRGSFDLARDQEELLHRSLALLAPGGRLWFSAAARSFRLGGSWPGFRVHDFTENMRDADFQGKKIPGTWLFEA